MSRTAILAACVAALFGLAGLGAGCSAGPYTGKPEKLKKPRAKKRKDGKATAVQADGEGGVMVMSDEPCRTNFFAPPFNKRRASSTAKSMAAQADQALLAAERKVGPGRQEMVVDAMATLGNALRKDPYAPEPTYKLAVAYALAGKRKCSVALLERLKSLADYPPTEAEASRTIQRAARDPAFKPFEKDARTALGE